MECGKTNVAPASSKMKMEQHTTSRALWLAMMTVRAGITPNTGTQSGFRIPRQLTRRKSNSPQMKIQIRRCEMREIKFRAWNKGQECYLYGVQGAYDTLSGWVKYENGEDADYDEECFGSFLDNKWYDVEQFTGLKDTNGNEIYENDLVRLDDDSEDHVYKVIFDEAKFEISGDGFWYDLGEEFRNCEVIGNVHTETN